MLCNLAMLKGHARFIGKKSFYLDDQQEFEKHQWLCMWRHLSDKVVPYANMGEIILLSGQLFEWFNRTCTKA